MGTKADRHYHKHAIRNRDLNSPKKKPEVTKVQSEKRLAFRKKLSPFTHVYKFPITIPF